MPKIKQLSLHEAQKIAAGEVVERPANIVKELIENAIDAGATRISIYIEDGGKQLIRVTDNGCGMDAIDAQKCFDRHATSKITRVDELELIDTFGFRGEALASIASVSTITLLTKEEQNLEGTQVIIEANTITQVNTIACSTGTDVRVHNLFFNIPARKKFLKSTQTEWRSIQLLCNAFCFAYPHIHFTLFSEGKQLHNYPSVDDLKNRALQLFEPTTHRHLLTIGTNADISVAGVISDHQQYRYDRSGMYIFVNRRWVKNQHLSSALIKGYANVIPHGRYPLGVIHITVPAHEVDINIHPRKEEVKFLHPRRVEQVLQNVVKTALENNLSHHITKNVTSKSSEQKILPQQDFKSFEKKSEFVSFDTLRTNGDINDNLYRVSHEILTEWRKTNGNENIIEKKDKFVPDLSLFMSNHSNPFVLSSSKETNTTDQIVSASPPLILPACLPSIALAEDGSKDSEEKNYHLIGQYNTTYLLIEKENGLLLVDQHAAHERILYELFSQRFHEVATIQLLFPQIITLNTNDIDLIIPHLEIFIENGIIIEQCARDQLIVQSLPVHLKDQSLTEIVKEAIAWIIECSSLEKDAFKKTIHHKLQAQMACKAAVKAGDVLTHEKMEQLLCDLEKTANRFSCPHGRPTSWLLSLAEIEKKFKRRF